jgi:superfamily II DNA or RNA helicase
VVQFTGRILRTCDGKNTAEVHDYHDELTGVLSAAVAKMRARLQPPRLPDPRRLPSTAKHQHARPGH